MNDPKIKAAIKLLDEAIRLLGIAYVDHCATVEPESLPLMTRDTCTNCGGTGVGGHHVHAPQEDAVEALRCEACDGFGFIEHGPEDCPATAPELPLMARRSWMLKGAQYAYRDRDSAWFQSVDKPGRAWEFCYRIADTDEHGLPVIPREPGMPEGARYRGWTGSAQRWSYYTRYIKRHAHGRFERIEDYRESGQEGRG